MIPQIIRDLDIEGWRPLLFELIHIGKSEVPDFEQLAPAGDGLKIDDPTVLRIECWIVEGRQYIFTERTDETEEWSPPTLGEYEQDELDAPAELGCELDITNLDQLVPIAANACKHSEIVHLVRGKLLHKSLRNAMGWSQDELDAWVKTVERP